jgi:hypothetical protein
MGAFAGWLHHPAHAPSHYKNVCEFDHGVVLAAKSAGVNSIFYDSMQPN